MPEQDYELQETLDDTPTPNDVREQIGIISRAMSIKRAAKRRIALFEFLVEAKLEGRFNPGTTGRATLIEFEVNNGYPKARATAADEDQAYNRARQIIGRLSLWLERYYAGHGADDRVEISIPLSDSASGRESETYEPSIKFNPRIAGQPQRIDAWLLGDNEAALNYVTERIPKLKRIEETFIRLIEKDSSLYEGSAFSSFLKALQGSSLLYRAVLGPMTDLAVFEEGGLRDVLVSRAVKVPKGKLPAKLYRLLHDGPVMNFTLLYYTKAEENSTNNAEVLFGYGLNERNDSVEDTAVFCSNEERLIIEFQELFKALRSGHFSRPLELSQPEHFRNEPRSCDVIATFPELPEKEVMRKIQASGIPLTNHSPEHRAALSRSEKYIPGRPHIKICVSALQLLAHQPFLNELGSALERGVQVSITLWKPGQVLDQRAKVAGMGTTLANHELTGALEGLRTLVPHPNLFVRECTGEFASVSIIWIDELIYFSAYWVGENVSGGPHFVVLADSPTGKALRLQYDRMLPKS